MSFQTGTGSSYYNYGAQVQVQARFWGDQAYGAGDNYVTVKCNQTEDIIAGVIHFNPNDSDSGVVNLTTDSCNVDSSVSTLSFTAIINDNDGGVVDDCTIYVYLIRLDGLVSYAAVTGPFDDFPFETQAVAIEQQMCFKACMSANAYPGYAAGLVWYNADSAGSDRATATYSTPMWLTVTAVLNSECWINTSASRTVAWVKATLNKVTLEGSSGTFARIGRDSDGVLYGSDMGGTITIGL